MSLAKRNLQHHRYLASFPPGLWSRIQRAAAIRQLPIARIIRQAVDRSTFLTVRTHENRQAQAPSKTRRSGSL